METISVVNVVVFSTVGMTVKTDGDLLSTTVIWAGVYAFTPTSEITNYLF